MACHLWSSQPHHACHVQILELHSLGRDIESPDVYLTCIRTIRAKLLTCDWCLLVSYTVTLSEEKIQPLGILRIDERSEGKILVGSPRPIEILSPNQNLPKFSPLCGNTWKSEFCSSKWLAGGNIIDYTLEFSISAVFNGKEVFYLFFTFIKWLTLIFFICIFSPVQDISKFQTVNKRIKYLHFMTWPQKNTKGLFLVQMQVWPLRWG